jgi:signal peptidase II
MLRYLLLLSAVVVALDQLTKQLADRYLSAYDPLPVMPSFNLTLSFNPGAAFSFLADAGGWQRWFFTVLAIGVSAAIVVWLRRITPGEWRLGVGLALILGGAVGNVIDRLIYGHVIDFIDVYYGDWHWPAFNIADSAITVGAAFLIVDSLLGGSRRRQQAQQ